MTGKHTEKQGTLTRNDMRFKYCAIGDKLYGGCSSSALDITTNDDVNANDDDSANESTFLISRNNRNEREGRKHDSGQIFPMDITTGPSVTDVLTLDSFAELQQSIQNSLDSGPSKENLSSAMDVSKVQSFDTLDSETAPEFPSPPTDKPPDESSPDSPSGTDRVAMLQQQTERIHDFFMCLVTNHSVLPFVSTDNSRASFASIDEMDRGLGIIDEQPSHMGLEQCITMCQQFCNCFEMENGEFEVGEKSMRQCETRPIQ